MHSIGLVTFRHVPVAGAQTRISKTMNMTMSIILGSATSHIRGLPYLTTLVLPTYTFPRSKPQYACPLVGCNCRVLYYTFSFFVSVSVFLVKPDYIVSFARFRSICLRRHGGCFVACSPNLHGPKVWTLVQFSYSRIHSNRTGRNCSYLFFCPFRSCPIPIGARSNPSTLQPSHTHPPWSSFVDRMSAPPLIYGEDKKTASSPRLAISFSVSQSFHDCHSLLPL